MIAEAEKSHSGCLEARNPRESIAVHSKKLKPQKEKRSVTQPWSETKGSKDP
jgi:hypothetical protein